MRRRALSALALLALGVATAHAAAASVGFRSGFEDAVDGRVPGPWPAFEYRGVFTPGYPVGKQLRVIRDPERGKAVRFVVHPGDRYGGSSGERALLRWLSSDGKTGSFEREGDDFYYGWATRFPTGWTKPPGWAQILEFHADSRFMLAPIRLNAGADSLSVDMTTGECSDNYRCAYRQNHQVLDDLAKGRWHDFVLHVRWSKTDAGVVQLWHRLEGGADGWTKVLDLDAVPTLPWFAGRPDPTIYLLWGLYTGAGASVRAVEGDAFSRGGSFAEVAATLAPPASAPGL